MQQWNLDTWSPITTSVCETPLLSSTRSPTHQPIIPSSRNGDACTNGPCTGSTLPTIPCRYPYYNNLEGSAPGTSGFGEDTFSAWNSFEFAAAAASAQTRSVYSNPFNPPSAPTPINPTAAAAAAVTNQHREAAFLSASAATGTNPYQISHRPTATYPFGVAGKMESGKGCRFFFLF